MATAGAEVRGDAADALEARLLPILRCPACGRDPLALRAGAAPGPTPRFAVADRHLACDGCGAGYPLTSDLIPVVWSPGLRDWMIGQASAASTNVGANVEIYDIISSDYEKYTRQNAEIGRRITAAVRRATSGGARGALHLDFGCGPGHVIDWLRGEGLTSIGLDVSLENLRNVRRATGALVVCGDATAMPFKDGVFGVVTESSALHHIEDWRAAVREACRVAGPRGGVVIDSEPSREHMAWSRLATALFEARFPVYKALSYVLRDKYMFRDIEQAKRNLEAEIHHQPGTGFPVDELEATFAGAGFEVETVRSPTDDLRSVGRPSWKGIVLQALSLRNPWDPTLGLFTTIARRRGA